MRGWYLAAAAAGAAAAWWWWTKKGQQGAAAPAGLPRCGGLGTTFRCVPPPVVLAPGRPPVASTALFGLGCVDARPW